HSQGGQVVQLAGDAGEVAHPGAVGVGEAARINLVDHGVGSPRLAYRHAVTLAAVRSCSKVAENFAIAENLAARSASPLGPGARAPVGRYALRHERCAQRTPR